MRRSILTVSAVLALTLTACGDASGGESGAEGTTRATEAVPASPEPEEETEEAADASDPCSLATEDDVAAAYGEPAPLDGPPHTTQHDDEGLEYTSTDCGWESDALEVALLVSVAADFPGGELQCPPLSYLGDEAVPVKGVGAPASFVGSDGINEVEGWLRVCTDDVTFDVEVDAPLDSRDNATMRDQNVALAKVVLGNLG